MLPKVHVPGRHWHPNKRILVGSVNIEVTRVSSCVWISRTSIFVEAAIQPEEMVFEPSRFNGAFYLVLVAYTEERSRLSLPSFQACCW